MATIAITSLAYAMNIASASISMTSPQSIWLVMGQFQLLMLLLLSDAYIPKDVETYILGMDYTLFSFNFLKIKEWKFPSKIYEYFDYDQSKADLILVGFSSGSAIINILSILITL